jgi:hypothetical protein
MEQMRAFVKKEINLLLQNDQRNFLESRGTVNFQEGLCHLEPVSNPAFVEGCENLRYT